MAFAKKFTEWAGKLGSTLKSSVKIAIESRRCSVKIAEDNNFPLIIMGNGPSLSDTIRDCSPALLSHPLMAVNFAANTDEFYQLHPKHYVLADPVFFAETQHENVVKLWENLTGKVNWPMTIFVPAKYKEFLNASSNPNLHIEWFNPVGVEGFKWIENAAFSSGRGMPRPRNVLIVAIMVAIKMGYRTIYLTGADHSWTRTLEVSEENMVISVQPHFYKDNEAEHSRIASVYKDIRLHQILHSFYIAFRSYFAIKRYADSHGIHIYNATPGSFIDAFERKSLSQLTCK